MWRQIVEHTSCALALCDDVSWFQSSCAHVHFYRDVRNESAEVIRDEWCRLLLMNSVILLFPPQGSKVDEDYDTYIENLMTQLRQLPPMSVLEPALSRNYAVCPIFGSGDLTKIGMSRDYSTRQGDLKGTFGVAHLAHVSDHYNTQPFGDLPPLPPQPPVSTQRGFYDQEFAALKLENDGECSYGIM